MEKHKIGIIGGMSYQATSYYYNEINRKINEIVGDLHCAELIIYNVDFDTIKKWIDKDEWKEVGVYLANIANQLDLIGIEYVIIATDTMHKVIDKIQRLIGIPIIHIADCVAEECLNNNIHNVGLIGSIYTMQENFLKERLENYNLSIHIPEDTEKMKKMNNIIFEELCYGKVLESSKEYYLEIINEMIKTKQIEGIILSCTELSLLISQEDINIPLFNTTDCHINKIIDYYLGKPNIKKLTKY